MSQRERHADNSRVNQNKLDRLGMLSRLARLKSSALWRTALGRAIVIMLVAMTYSFAAAEKINSSTIEEKPFNRYNLMNVKLYLHNSINDWDEFECAIELGHSESSWRFDAVNKSSGAYGLFQHMSKHAHKWNVFTQIDKHNEYVNRRYDGSWCKALQHLKGKGWH